MMPDPSAADSPYGRELRPAKNLPLLTRLRDGLRATPRQYFLYVSVFFIWGVSANHLGKVFEIAEFRHWWQVITCYLGYLVPVSLLLRRKSRFEQYVYGVFALAPLELVGYALGSSIAHEHNIIDQLLGPRNFTLFMSVFFGIIPPIGNAIVKYLDSRLPGAGTTSPGFA